MKRVIALVLVALMCIGCCGCGSEKHYEAKDYILETEYKDDFKILQLCDTHLANKDNRQLQYDFLDIVIKDADADMIVVVGDLFTFADKTVAKEFFAFLDSYNVPWTVTFGNHDEQCYFSIDWLTNYLNNFGSNCLFKDILDDDVYGNANFAINLKKNNEIKSQVIIMDSNRYNYGEYWGYDYIKDDQIKWYEDVVTETTKQNGGSTVPSIAFFHIPVPEFQIAWDQAEQKVGTDAIYEYGEINEPVSCPQYNSGFFDSVLKMGSTKAICCAHDHVNNWLVNYKGVDLCYGVTSTDRIYYQDGMIGGQVITIHNDGSLSYDRLYHTYQEVADNE
ncbi:MAG: metallophosphoesterase [Bacillota bacterium]|nr:metallophosphoesterase [Bacillota bacterium]